MYLANLNEERHQTQWRPIRQPAHHWQFLSKQGILLCFNLLTGPNRHCDDPHVSEILQHCIACAGSKHQNVKLTEFTHSPTQCLVASPGPVHTSLFPKSLQPPLLLHS